MQRAGLDAKMLKVVSRPVDRRPVRRPAGPASCREVERLEVGQSGYRLEECTLPFAGENAGQRKASKVGELAKNAGRMEGRARNRQNHVV